MLPVVALVGRPNVGKSTLFNRLTRTRDALVADQPGLTRDRKYGIAKMGNRSCIVIDTGGLTGDGQGVEVLMADQVRLAIGEADHLLFLVDGRAGRTAADEAIAAELRTTGKPVTLVVNKSEGAVAGVPEAEFHQLGLGRPLAISAEHGRGVRSLVDGLLDRLPQPPSEAAAQDVRGILIAVVGRPNVGKSTLVNRLLGEDRVLVFDEPGTTRDSIFVRFERDGRAYTLIDTAGVRRRGRIRDAVEKFCVIKTLQAVEQANVVLMVVDAHQGVGEQDANLAGHVLESGRAMVLVVNKWDGLATEDRGRIKAELERKLPFLDFAPKKFVSALHGSGVGELLRAVDKAYASATKSLSTPELNRILEVVVREHQPPVSRGHRIKLRYAHQGGQNPPIVVIHGSQTEALPASYQRYLTNRFREALNLYATPIKLELRSGENPFAGRRNPITERQLRKRQGLKDFVRRKK